jgi:hypothetical protein
MEELHPNIEFVVYDIEGGEKAQSTLPTVKEIQDIRQLAKDSGLDDQIKNK